MAAKFLKALEIRWGIEQAVGIPVYKLNAVKLVKPVLNLAKMSLSVRATISGVKILPLSYTETTSIPY